MNTSRNSIIGKNIRERRKEEGLSQSQVADSLGVTMQAVSLWEQGRTTVSPKKLDELAEVLRCDVSVLTTDMDSKEEIKANIHNINRDIDSMSAQIIDKANRIKVRTLSDIEMQMLRSFFECFDEEFLFESISNLVEGRQKTLEDKLKTLDELKSLTSKK